MAHEDSPQGHREPPTRAELRAWRRWKRKDATAEASATQAAQAQAQDWRATGTYVHHISPRARKALAPTPDHRTTTQALSDAYTERAQTHGAGDWVQRMTLDHVARAQRDATAFLGTAHQTAESTQQAIFSTADRTQRDTLALMGKANQTAERMARTNIILSVESLAIALSIATSAWLLIDTGQRLGMAYGITAYQAWVAPAHGTRDAQD